MRRGSRDGFRRWCDRARLRSCNSSAARRNLPGLRPLLNSAAMRNDIFTATYSLGSVPPKPYLHLVQPSFARRTSPSQTRRRVRQEGSTWLVSWLADSALRAAPPGASASPAHQPSTAHTTPTGAPHIPVSTEKQQQNNQQRKCLL